MRRRSIPKIAMNLLLAMTMIVVSLSFVPQGATVAAVGPAADPVTEEAAEPAASADARGGDFDTIVSLAPPVPAAANQIAAPTDTITLRVINARTEPRALDGAGVVKGEAVAQPYKWIINVDNTGDPFWPTFPDCSAYLDPPTNTIVNPEYPDSCPWPGIRTVPGWSPIYSQGDQDDLNETTGITLPPGKYLISVLVDGYKMDGEHFTIPMEEPGLVTVAAHPLPLPPASMEIKVFHDRSLTNGQFDAPVEQGLAGFRASLNDIAGEITTDLFGNPLCTIYEDLDADGYADLDIDGNPIIETLGQGCVSDENGIIVIPNIGPIRYDVLVTPPDGETWIQTTTLEGSHGWDTWLQEAGTGLDNEFLIAAEPFPWTIFGFVAPTDTLTPAPDTGSVKGVIMGAISYTPFEGGLPYQGQVWSGFVGVELDQPIESPWLALNDLQNGDTAIWVGQGNADGSFQIDDIPPGDYVLTYWDYNQHYILDFVQFTVAPNAVTDIGIRTMTNWFTNWFGYVFLDYNENGIRDPNEPGVPDYLVVLRDRDNTEIDRMSIASVSDATGFWELPKGYPMNWWMVLEAYSDLYRTTGYTFQTSNQPEPTTILGAGVDVSVLPILGQWGRLDWGVKPYGPDENGGIAGSVFYDTVRAEDDARYAGVEPWQPGIPDLEVLLWATVKGPTGEPITVTDPTSPDFGAYVKGPLLASTVTESYVRPKNCQPRDVNGDPVTFPLFPPAEPDADNPEGYDCIETLAMGTQFGTEYAQLPGNWGFSEIYTDPVTGAPLAEPQPLAPDHYLVEVVVPTDPVFGRPLYKVTREEDVNTFDGDTFVPQIPPPECAGPLHVVDVAGIAPDGPNAVANPNYAAEGGSRFEGQQMPLCNIRLVDLGNARSVAPTFLFFTDVMIPGRWKGYIIDDMTVSTDPYTLFYGEKAGVGLSPIGVYDWQGQLEHTVHSDPHGVYEVLLPSDQTTNAPTPSGMLSNMYYIYGNDPGQPGAFNELYNPAFRSIGTSFEIYPGVMVPSDLAPIQNAVNFQAPGSQQTQVPACKVSDTTPQIFRVSQPYGARNTTFTITGIGFGAQRGSGAVYLGSSQVPVVSWSDRELVVRVTPSIAYGPHQLSIRTATGARTVNGLTFHVRGGAYNPPLFEVGPGKPYSTIQSAIDAAAGYADPANPTAPVNGLVVVYPGFTQTFTNPMGIWFENPVIYSPVKLQGVGAGGVYTDGTAILGTVLDGRAYGGDTPYTGVWRTLVGDIWLNRGGWDGSLVDGNNEPIIYEGQVVTVLAEDGEFTSAFPATIDGFTIQGGHQQGQPTNITQTEINAPGLPDVTLIQGGGIWVNAYARYFQILNNVVQSNGGSYAGAIRIGTPNVPEPLTDHQNDYVRIGYNRILANGGTNLAGAIGIFAGAANYEIAYNDICGNFGAEYGGGISHYGYSPNGSIHHNRVYFNRSYDEGGGIMIAGELPADFTQLSPGAGPVNVYANLIQANLANDDGGGLRFLMAGDFTYNVYNNIIVNNVSTHEGGGISINDAPDVRVYNNTIMKNITTATAMTSDGTAAPAGLSTSRNSNLLQATLPAGSPLYSNPLVFNNIFWDNRAGTRVGDGVAGIGLTGDPFPIFHWDLGVSDRSANLAPTYSLLQVPSGSDDSTNLVGQDPLVVETHDVSVSLFAWRGNPNFVGADIVSVDLPVGEMGDYHLTTGSPARNAGAASQGGISAPNQDYDRQPRPFQGQYDIGADEIGGPFPSTPVLFGAATSALNSPVTSGGVSIQASSALTYHLFLPMVAGGSGLQAPAWGGDTEAFTFDEAAGTVTVADDGLTHWNLSMFGSDQEAYFTFSSVVTAATKQDLLLKVGGLGPNGAITDASRLLAIQYNAASSEVTVATLSPGGVWNTFLTLGGIDFVAGDRFGARSSQGGLVEVYRNDEPLGIADLSEGPSPWAYYDYGGYIGVWFEGAVGASFGLFGGGTMP